MVAQAGSFGFAHLSVREFLEGLKSRSIDAYLPTYGHAALASVCVQFLNQELSAVKPVEIPPEFKEDPESQHNDSSKDSQDSPEAINKDNYQDKKKESPLLRYVTVFWIFHTLRSESLRTSTELHGHIMAFMTSGGRATVQYDTWYKNVKEWGND